MLKLLRLRDVDWLLLGLALFIAGVGVLEIYSTTLHTPLVGQYRKQIYWTLFGTVGALLISQIDYHSVVKRAPWLYLIGVAALVALLVIGHRTAGARRWLPIGGWTFQVSEIVKLVIIIAVAAYFGEARAKHVTYWDLAGLGLLVGIPAALVAAEPDLGTALTFFPAAATGVFLAGIRARQIGLLVLLGALMLPVGWHFLHAYQRERIVTFVHPSRDTQGAGYQVAQSKIAVGSGGFWGKGLGNGTQSQLGFIPVSQADFIFAAFAEERGFVGILVVLLLYLGLLIRLLDSAQMAGDRAGTLLIAGLASVMFFQVAVNTGMMIGFLPTTGIPLPLMSQGGSSLFSTFLGVGLAIGVRARRLVN